jgi:signal peptidase II
MTLYYIIMILCFLLDQISKAIIRNNLDVYESVTVIRNFFHITYVENTGAAWSILQGGRWFFVSVTVIMIIIFFIYLYKVKNIWFRTAASLIIGGGFGNLTDRIISGKVIDFIDLNFWSYDYPVFNISDSCVFIGTIVLFIYVLRHEGPKKK